MSDERFVGSVQTEESIVKLVTVAETKPNTKKNEKGLTKKVSFLRRLPSIRSSVTPNLHNVRGRLRKLNCFKTENEEDLPVMEMPRHKSIDISVGLARRASLFLFRRKSVCMHPYHPYTPRVTTRKIYFGYDIKNHSD